MHKETRKQRTGIRRKGILWEYNGDGRYTRERYSPADKRYWRRWRRRQGKCGGTNLDAAGWVSTIVG